MMTTEELKQEKFKYFIEANGGISLPAAGFIYWLGLGIAGYYLDPKIWAIAGFFTSGLIFPLGLLLSKPLKSNLLVKHPLASVVMPAMMAMFLSWPMTIAGFVIDVSLVPLCLAIGMSLHWPVIGWMYGNKSCFIHRISSLNKDRKRTS